MDQWAREEEGVELQFCLQLLVVIAYRQHQAGAMVEAQATFKALSGYFVAAAPLSKRTVDMTFRVMDKTSLSLEPKALLYLNKMGRVPVKQTG